MTIEGTLGFLGFGNMGEAIAKGLVEKGVAAKGSVFVYDVAPDKVALAASAGLRTVLSPSELATAADTLILAVKPQFMDEALAQLRPAFSSKTLVISIAAGLSITYFKERLGADARIVRVMPNTPALVSAGAAGYAVSDNCTEADAVKAQEIFAAIGIVEAFSEDMIDVVTALSASGPAYFFYMVECLVKAAVALGMPEAQADRLARQTLLGSGRLLTESADSAAVLRAKVTSKGGTTEAALNRFQAGDFEALVQAAVNAAFQRAGELGK